MMDEQYGTRELVADLVQAKQAGFEFSVASDRYFPWLEGQAYCPYAGACWVWPLRPPSESR